MDRPNFNQHGNSLIGALVGVAVMLAAAAALMRGFDNAQKARVSGATSEAYARFDGAVRGALINRIHAFVWTFARPSSDPSGPRVPLNSTTFNGGALAASAGTVVLRTTDMTFRLVDGSLTVPALSGNDADHQAARNRCNSGPKVDRTATYMSLCYLIDVGTTTDDRATRGIAENLPIFVEVYYGLGDLATQDGIAFSGLATAPRVAATVYYTIYWQNKVASGVFSDTHSGMRYVPIR